MFRKNYVPKVRIQQDFDTKKWVAYGTYGNLACEAFVQMRSGMVREPDALLCHDDSLSYEILSCYAPTRFDSLDDLLAAIYEYAYTEHLEHIKRSLTDRSVSVST